MNCDEMQNEMWNATNEIVRYDQYNVELLCISNFPSRIYRLATSVRYFFLFFLFLFFFSCPLLKPCPVAGSQNEDSCPRLTAAKMAQECNEPLTRKTE